MPRMGERDAAWAAHDAKLHMDVVESRIDALDPETRRALRRLSLRAADEDEATKEAPQQRRKRAHCKKDTDKEGAGGSKESSVYGSGAEPLVQIRPQPLTSSVPTLEPSPSPPSSLQPSTESQPPEPTSVAEAAAPRASPPAAAAAAVATAASTSAKKQIKFAADDEVVAATSAPTNADASAGTGGEDVGGGGAGRGADRVASQATSGSRQRLIDAVEEGSFQVFDAVVPAFFLNQEVAGREGEAGAGASAGAEAARLTMKMGDYLRLRRVVTQWQQETSAMVLECGFFGGFGLELRIAVENHDGETEEASFDDMEDAAAEYMGICLAIAPVEQASAAHDAVARARFHMLRPRIPFLHALASFAPSLLRSLAPSRAHATHALHSVAWLCTRRRVASRSSPSRRRRRTRRAPPSRSRRCCGCASTAARAASSSVRSCSRRCCATDSST